MTVYTSQITDTANDGADDGSTYFVAGVTAGPDAFFGATYTAGLRFASVAIPSITIDSATLLITAAGSDTATTATLHGAAADTVSPFSDSNLPSSQRKTSASTSVPHGDIAGTEYSVNVTAVIQEILSRGGWVSGNALALIIEATGGTAQWGDWGDIGRPSASLTIGYDGSSSTFNEVVEESVTANASLVTTLATNGLSEVFTAAASFTATVTCRPTLAEAVTTATAVTATFSGWTHDSPSAASWNLNTAATSIWTPTAPTSTNWT